MGMLGMNVVSFDVEIEVPEHIRTVSGQFYMNTVERAMSMINMGLQSAFQKSISFRLHLEKGEH
jgi:hypothetical protein